MHAADTFQRDERGRADNQESATGNLDSEVFVVDLERQDTIVRENLKKLGAADTKDLGTFTLGNQTQFGYRFQRFDQRAA